MIAIAIADLLAGRVAETLSNLSYVTVMGASLAYLRFGGSLKAIVRFGFAAGQFMVIYEMTTKVDDTLVLQWLYLQPISIFFLVGRREGAFWVTERRGRP